MRKQEWEIVLSDSTDDDECVMLDQKAAKKTKKPEKETEFRQKQSLAIKEQMDASRNELIEEQSKMEIIKIAAPEGDEVASEIWKLKKLNILKKIKQQSAETSEL